MSSFLAFLARAETRASVFHFTVFLPVSVSAVYFAIWLSGRGISPEQIGIINAVPVLVLLLINLFIGRLADKAGDWRTMILIMALLAGSVPIGLFFVDEFWGILLVWTLVAVSSGSIPPVVDAATVRMTTRNGSDFGTVRAWGTVGYVAGTALTGMAIVWWGEMAFVPLFVGLSLFRAVIALQLPRFRAPPTQELVATAIPRAGALGQVMKPWFVLPVIAYALVNATHAVLSTLAALVWHNEGISEGTIGQLIAVGAGAEAVMMFVWRRVGARVTARHMILAAALATIVRWTVMGLNPPIGVLFGLQTLHAVTYALGYFGLVHFIANWTSEEIAAEAQGFAFVLQQAMSVVTLMAFGWLIAQWGVASFFAAAGLGVAALACVLVSLRMMPAK